MAMHVWTMAYIDHLCNLLKLQAVMMMHVWRMAYIDQVWHLLQLRTMLACRCLESLIEIRWMLILAAHCDDNTCLEHGWSDGSTHFDTP